MGARRLSSETTAKRDSQPMRAHTFSIMREGSLPPSNLIGSKVELPAPCGKHVIYYPAGLADAAMRECRYHAFHTSCECGRAYIVATQDDGAHFRGEGDDLAIASMYERIPWPEIEIHDANGIFFAKEAPSLVALKEHFARDAERDRRQMN